VRRPFVATFASVLVGASGVACQSANDAPPPPPDASTGIDSSAGDVGGLEVADAGGDGDGNPDAPTCPDARPILGAECHLPRTLGCPFPDICPQAPSPGGNDTFICLSGAWSTDPDAYMLDCPTPPPDAGSTCLCAAHQLYEGCVNLLCYDGEPSAWVICDDQTKAWIEEPLPCNPPPLDADVDDADADETDAADDAADESGDAGSLDGSPSDAPATD